MQPDDDPPAQPPAADEPATREVSQLGGEPAALADPDWAADVAPGTLVGRYIVTQRVGAGGAGLVYAAFDPELNRKVAIKLVRAGEGEAATASLVTAGNTSSTRRALMPAQQRLLREAQAMAKLTHANVVPVYDVGTFRDRVFLAMELMDGGTLRGWMRDHQQSWRAALQVVAAAGRGLAAAHAAGLVHRDFKPDNVLLSSARGKGGLPHDVRVTDFGLVRAERRAEPPPRAPGDDASAESPLTRMDAVMGTPGYMAPEQYLAAPTDARTDQFSFCVTLWEAVHGARPFAGKSFAELHAAAISGAIQEPPAGSTAPRWLRKVLTRGLATSPDARWPSMDALLDQLGRDPDQARRRVGLGVAALVLVAGAAAGGYRVVSERAQRCSGAPARLVGVWDDAVRAQVTAGFGATGLGYAAAALRTVEATLDGYARGWTAMHREACEATQRGEQTPLVQELRYGCLDERLGELRGLTGALAHPDAQVVQHAPEAALGLTPLRRCADVAALRLPLKPPTDPTRLAAVERLRVHVGELHAQLQVGRSVQVQPEIERSAQAAAALGWAPLTAEAELLAGNVLEANDHPQEAEARYRAAAVLAEESGHDRVRAQAWLQLVHVVGYGLARHKDALAWAQQARPLVTRLGNEPELEADYLYVVGTVYREAGMHDEELKAKGRALQLRRQLNGEDSLEAANAHGDYGTALAMATDDYAGAERENLIALAGLVRVLGPDHPDVADTLTCLGSIAKWDKRPKDAVVYLERALAVQQRSLQADDSRIGVTLTHLGAALRALGRWDDAERAYERCIAIYEKRFGRDYGDLVHPLHGLGAARLESGRAVARAVPPLERGLALAEATDHEIASRMRFALARALWAGGGDRTRARKLAEAALARTKDKADARAEIGRWLSTHR